MSTPVSPARSADHVEAALDLLAARPLVVLTGAGLSTDSGIPDYRGPDAPPRRPMTYQEFVSGPTAQQRYWARSHLGWGRMRRADPNEGHHVLARIAPDLLITQNVDGLHQDAGTNPEKVLEIHGTMREVMCMSCGDRAPMEVAFERVRAGEADPACLSCGGILKSATISFGQGLVAEDLARSQQAALECDLMFAIGTTLAVFPIAAVVPVAHRAGASVVILNAEATEMDDLADVVLRGQIGEILPALI